MSSPARSVTAAHQRQAAKAYFEQRYRQPQQHDNASASLLVPRVAPIRTASLEASTTVAFQTARISSTEKNTSLNELEFEIPGDAPANHLSVFPKRESEADSSNATLFTSNDTKDYTTMSSNEQITGTTGLRGWYKKYRNTGCGIESIPPAISLAKSAQSETATSQDDLGSTMSPSETVAEIQPGPPTTTNHQATLPLRQPSCPTRISPPSMTHSKQSSTSSSTSVLTGKNSSTSWRLTSRGRLRDGVSSSDLSSVTVHHNPGAIGGVLAQPKWFHLSHTETDFSEAIRNNLGQINTDENPPTLILDLQNVSAVECKRQEVIYELILTEREYVRDLKIIINLFEARLKKEHIIPLKSVSLIFSNIGQLLPVNEALLVRLENRRREKFGFVDNVGETFVTVAQFLKIYTIYCGNQPEALSHLKSLRENLDLKVFLQYCLLRPECRGLDLPSFLLKPTQRICKYPLLLRELIKYTPEDHIDYKNLAAAYDQINNVVTVVNERRRFVENQQALLGIMQRLDFDRVKMKHEPSRLFVHEGPLYRINESSLIQSVTPRWGVLFSDVFVMAKNTMFGSKMQVLKSLPVGVLSVKESADSDRHKNNFEVVVGNRKHYLFSVATPAERATWVTKFQNVIADDKEKIKGPRTSPRTSITDSVSMVDSADSGRVNERAAISSAPISPQNSEGDLESPVFAGLAQQARQIHKKAKSFDGSVQKTVRTILPPRSASASNIDKLLESGSFAFIGFVAGPSAPPITQTQAEPTLSKEAPSGAAVSASELGHASESKIPVKQQLQANEFAVPTHHTQTEQAKTQSPIPPGESETAKTAESEIRQLLESSEFLRKLRNQSNTLSAIEVKVDGGTFAVQIKVSDASCQIQSSTINLEVLESSSLSVQQTVSNQAQAEKGMAPPPPPKPKHLVKTPPAMPKRAPHTPAKLSVPARKRSTSETLKPGSQADLKLRLRSNSGTTSENEISTAQPTSQGSSIAKEVQTGEKSTPMNLSRPTTPTIKTNSQRMKSSSPSIPHNSNSFTPTSRSPQNSANPERHAPPALKPKPHWNASVKVSPRPPPPSKSLQLANKLEEPTRKHPPVIPVKPVHFTSPSRVSSQSNTPTQATQSPATSTKNSLPPSPATTLRTIRATNSFNQISGSPSALSYATARSRQSSGMSSTQGEYSTSEN